MDGTGTAQKPEIPQYSFEPLDWCKLTQEDVEDLKPLFAELTASQTQGISREELVKILRQRNFHMEVARGPKPEKTIVAMATAHLHRGRHLREIAYIDDVATHPAHQGQRLSRKIMARLISHAQNIWKAACIDLTCNPARTKANNMYPRMGFQLLEDAVILRYEAQEEDTLPTWDFLSTNNVHAVGTLMGRKLFVDMATFENLLNIVYIDRPDSLRFGLVKSVNAYRAKQINITVPARLLGACAQLLASGFTVRETNVYRLPLPVDLAALQH